MIESNTVVNYTELKNKLFETIEKAITNLSTMIVYGVLNTGTNVISLGRTLSSTQSIIKVIVNNQVVSSANYSLNAARNAIELTTTYTKDVYTEVEFTVSPTVPEEFLENYSKVITSGGTPLGNGDMNKTPNRQYSLGKLIPESLATTWTISKDKSTWYYTLIGRTDGASVAVIIPHDATTIEDGMFNYFIGVNDIANSVYPGKDGSWLLAYIKKDSTGIHWYDKYSVLEYDMVTSTEITENGFNDSINNIFSTKYSITTNSNKTKLIIKDQNNQTLKEFLVDKYVSVGNQTGMTYQYDLYSTSAIKPVTARTIETEFKQYLARNNINILEDAPVTTKNILSFWNAAAAFFSNKLSYAVSMLNTSKKPVMYLSDSRINEVLTQIAANSDPAEKINIESNRLVNNLPLIPISIYPRSDEDLGTSTSDANNNIDRATEYLITQINAEAKIKTMAYKFAMRCSCCSSSSCSSSCSSSSSSSFIVYKKL